MTKETEPISPSNDEHLLSSLDVEKMAQRDAETEPANKVDAEKKPGPAWWSPRETSTINTPSRAKAGVSLCTTMFTTRLGGFRCESPFARQSLPTPFESKCVTIG